MYFQWKDTPYGMIRVSHGGLKELVQGVVNTKQKLYGLSLRSTVQQEDADMSIVLSDENVIPEMKKKMEEHFTALFEPMGIKASVVWATPDKSIVSVVCSPWLWACIGACAAVLVNAGSSGFFWMLFWGAAGWFSMHGLNELAEYIRRP